MPDESQLPIDPSTDVPVGYSRRSAQPGQRFHRRSRCVRHLGHVVADPADRGLWEEAGCRPVRSRLPDGHAAPGPRHHPHLVVRHRGSQPPRARRGPLAPRRALGLDPRPRPQEDVEVEGQRRHTDRPVRPVRHRRRAVLGGIGSARHRHGVQRRPDEGRAQARQQAAQRLEVRAVVRRGADRHARDRSDRPVDARQTRRCHRRRHQRLRGVRLRPGARTHRVVLLVVLRQLRRARQGPRLRHPWRRSRQLGACRTADGDRARSSACSPRSCRSPPRRRGAGGTRPACTSNRGRDRPARPAIRP